MSVNFNVLTSIRSDQMLRSDATGNASSDVGDGDERQYYLLSLHRDRLVQACKAFGRDSKALEGEEGRATLMRVLQDELTKFAQSNKQHTPVKLRLEFTYQEHFHLTAACVPIVPLSTLYPTSLHQVPNLTTATYRIFISPLLSTPSLFTKYKTTNRTHYDRQRALLPVYSGSQKETNVLQEMLLVNDSKKHIMEGTITTPYFFRTGEWITPQEESGGHLGVTRKWALMRSLAREGIVLVDDVKLGEIVILSNGVRGFGWGRIEALEPH